MLYAHSTNTVISGWGQSGLRLVWHTKQSCRCQKCAWSPQCSLCWDDNLSFMSLLTHSLLGFVLRRGEEKKRCWQHDWNYTGDWFIAEVLVMHRFKWVLFFLFLFFLFVHPPSQPNQVLSLTVLNCSPTTHPCPTDVFSPSFVIDHYLSIFNCP